jgi:hypothetical protein
MTAMGRQKILAAALALHEFSPGRLAAFCGEDPDTVQDVLRTVPDLVEMAPGRDCRVLDPATLRAAIKKSEPGGPAVAERTRPRADGPDETALDARLVVAEETLVKCAAEESPMLRQVMAATARNNILQVIARIAPEQGPWWSIEPTGPRWASPAAPGDPVIPPPRLRADFALATITEREAAGEPVSGDYLVGTAVDLGRVSNPRADKRLCKLFECFVDLAANLAEPAGLTAGDESAPTRLLVALSWRRTRALAAQNVEWAAKTLVRLFQRLQEEHQPDHGPGAIDLYRFVEHLPDGWNRLVVYTDLLELLPRQFGCLTREDLLPGVLVEAVADAKTSIHLQGIAARLQDGLTRSPFRSDSALIGEVAHVLYEVALTTADLDDTVLPRSDQMRRQLLSLVGAPV